MLKTMEGSHVNLRVSTALLFRDRLTVLSISFVNTLPFAESENTAKKYDLSTNRFFVAMLEPRWILQDIPSGVFRQSGHLRPNGCSTYTRSTFVGLVVGSL